MVDILKTYPRVLINPLTPPSANRETMSPMCKNLDDEAIFVVASSWPLREVCTELEYMLLSDRILIRITHSRYSRCSSALEFS